MAKYLETLLGEDYHEGMSEDEIAEALEKKSSVKPEPAKNVQPSEDVVKLKKLLSEANSQAADFKKKYNSTLSEQQQKELEAEEEKKSLMDELGKYKHAKEVSEASAQFIEMGMDKSFADDTAENLTSGNFNNVIKNYKTFFNQRLEDEKKKAKAAMMDSFNKPAAGSGSETMTKEKFNKLSYSDQVEYTKTNPNWKEDLK
ncbi:MAG: hypothetical protein KA953_00475 [Lachnospiraceae bacterium]|nr:hypothetical protein [Lachnospiraceae bacterium]